MSIQMISSKIR